MADIALGIVEKMIKVALDIKDAVVTVKQNKKECRDIESVVESVTALLNPLDYTTEMTNNEAMRGALNNLTKSLERALELVKECQGTTNILHHFGAKDMAKDLVRAKDDIRTNLDVISMGAIAQNNRILNSQFGGAAPPPLPPPRGSTSSNELKASDDKDKISWVDVDPTRGSAMCYMLSSRKLHLEHGDKLGYWQWIESSSSRFAECAELLGVYFLAVIGEISTEDLSRGRRYAVYLVYKLASGAVGLNGTQKSKVRLYGERTVATSIVTVDPAGLGEDANVAYYPVARNDGWMELKLAEFGTDDMLNETAVIVDFREETTAVRKSGLIIEGMEFMTSY